MSKVVTEFPSVSGVPIHVEMEAPEGRGALRVGRGGEVIAQAERSFEEAVAGIRPIAEAILAQTTGLVQAPKSVEVSFGIKLSGEVGVILASSTAQAHVEVTLAWERES